ncbi:MAG: sugar phosphate isomerase/epimerase [Anaerolineae bacterium]|nr:sugar phosphate isomerase/epimerase [Anaerolineales bacterium]MCQ3976957.1 sugar phosphate isomerase/epimerase [Anaerolineae bacterium]
MKLGVFAVMFSGMKFEAALDYIKSVGVEAVEIGCGGYVGDAHCKPTELLNDVEAIAALKKAVTSRGLTISALSAHANPLHPNPDIGEQHRAYVTNGILMAEKLGVDTFVTFSGCPGGGPEDKHPNWVTCPWPPDFSETVKWQWEEVMIPYWQATHKFAIERGVRLAIEMHPGFCVYNPETALALREAVGENLGVNFDPSHLFWQGADPGQAIRALGRAIFHFHAKDTKIDPINATVNGVLDTKSYRDFARRSWIFRTVGYGHNEEVWRDMVSNLQLVGYEGVLSIEHEDGLMSKNEGFEKAVDFLKRIMIKQEAGEAFWA